MKKLFIITGQTATGKTSLASSYAKRLNGELINCDSRQVYKYLDIVTGKDIDLLKSSKIHLYDIADPKKRFSSYDFTVFAKKVIKTIESKGKTPIIVGGTYFYLKHLLHEFETRHKADWNLRRKLNKKSVQELQRMLNPKTLSGMNQSDRTNPRRLIRRIEIAQSALLPNKGEKELSKVYDIEIIGLRFKKKEDLEKRIRERVNERLQEGAINEVENLLKKGYTENDPGLQAIGYKELISYLKKVRTRKEAVEQWIIKELQYAKRQYTFMKKDKNIKWQDV